MAGCQAKFLDDRRGGSRYGRIRVCGMKAVVKTPTGMKDMKPGIWFCAKHAPFSLLRGLTVGGDGGANGV